tara:strand:+ start:8353 stop:9087 length:735 start_codon:yes stop_codon:yes gene_type:complete
MISKRLIGGTLTGRLLPLSLFGDDIHLLVYNEPLTMTFNALDVSSWNDQTKYGNDVSTPVTSQEPFWNTVTKALEFDGIGNQFVMPISVWDTDLLGTWCIRFEDQEGTGVNSFIIDAGYSNTDRILLYFNTADQLLLTIKDTSVSTVLTFPNVVTRSSDSNIILKSNGTTYAASQNGVDLGVPLTNNNGKWYGDLRDLSTKSVISGNSTGATYFQNAYKSILYINRDTTANEDTKVLTWLNNLE